MVDGMGYTSDGRSCKRPFDSRRLDVDSTHVYEATSAEELTAVMDDMSNVTDDFFGDEPANVTDDSLGDDWANVTDDMTPAGDEMTPATDDMTEAADEMSPATNEWTISDDDNSTPNITFVTLLYDDLPTYWTLDLLRKHVITKIIVFFSRHRDSKCSGHYVMTIFYTGTYGKTLFRQNFLIFLLEESV